MIRSNKKWGVKSRYMIESADDIKDNDEESETWQKEAEQLEKASKIKRCYTIGSYYDASKASQKHLSTPKNPPAALNLKPQDPTTSENTRSYWLGGTPRPPSSKAKRYCIDSSTTHRTAREHTSYSSHRFATNYSRDAHTIDSDTQPCIDKESSNRKLKCLIKDIGFYQRNLATGMCRAKLLAVNRSKTRIWRGNLVSKEYPLIEEEPADEKDGLLQSDDLESIEVYNDIYSSKDLPDNDKKVKMRNMTRSKQRPNTARNPNSGAMSPNNLNNPTLAHLHQSPLYAKRLEMSSAKVKDYIGGIKSSGFNLLSHQTLNLLNLQSIKKENQWHLSVKSLVQDIEKLDPRTAKAVREVFMPKPPVKKISTNQYQSQYIAKMFEVVFEDRSKRKMDLVKPFLYPTHTRDNQQVNKLLKNVPDGQPMGSMCCSDLWAEGMVYISMKQSGMAKIKKHLDQVAASSPKVLKFLHENLDKYLQLEDMMSRKDTLKSPTYG